MHPDLQAIDTELQATAHRPAVALRFALACVEEVAGNLESDAAIEVLQRLRVLAAADDGPDRAERLQQLAQQAASLASAHPGSKSIDGTRHAAVSATYALAKAASGRAVEAAAYAAYSEIYGYGGYAVNDPETFAEVHRRQLERLRALSR